MIIEILLLIVILWIVTTSYMSNKRSVKTLIETKNEHENKLAFVLHNLEHLCSLASVTPTFTLVPSDDKSWVEDKHCIHLLIWDQTNKRFYDDNTIMHAAIHELVHVLCPSVRHDNVHSDLFKQMEKYFLELAEKEGIIELTAPDSDYPCVTEPESHNGHREYATETEEYRQHEGYAPTPRSHRLSLRSR